MLPPSSFPRLVTAAGLALLIAACFQGAEPEKPPPPGYAGGFCLAPTAVNPQPHCKDGSLCDLEGAFCYDPLDPCEGFFCGGTDRGVCNPTAEGKPSCVCKPGFNNEEWPLYCCPNPGTGFDDLCGAQAVFEGDSHQELAWTPFEEG